MIDQLTRINKAIDKRMKRLAGDKKKKFAEGVEAMAHVSDKGYELVIVANGAKVYGEDGFETAEEALAFAETVLKRKGMLEKK